MPSPELWAGSPNPAAREAERTLTPALSHQGRGGPPVRHGNSFSPGGRRCRMRGYSSFAAGIGIPALQPEGEQDFARPPGK
jgi:hypothetical protein